MKGLSDYETTDPQEAHDAIERDKEKSVDRTTSPQLINVSWDDFQAGCERIAKRAGYVKGVYGIPTGGCFVALEVANLLDVPMLDNPPVKGEGGLIVDDLVDSGETMRPYVESGSFERFDALYVKADSPYKDILEFQAEVTPAGHWLVFPWEHSSDPDDAVLRLMQHAGIQATKKEAHRVYMRTQSALEDFFRREMKHG